MALYSITRCEGFMATSSRHVHIEIEAIITSESNNSQLCNILINIEEQHEPANENQPGQDTKITDSGTQQALGSDPNQKKSQTDTSSHMSAIIEDLFSLPDDLEIMDNNSTQDSSPDNKKNSEQHSSKDTLSGGGHKPITAKQKTLIQKMADEQNKNSAEVVNSMFNKSIDDLEGQEADTVIKSMRKNRR